VVEGVRRAVDADVVRLAELCRMAVTELAQTKGGPVFVRREARAEPVETSLAAAVSDPAQLVVAGMIDDAVVAYAAVRVEPLHDGDRLAVVTDLYVEPEAREIGLGEAMMNHVLDWCREQRCLGVDSIALPGNRATKNFFESMGLVARAIIVHRRLETDP